MTRLSSQTYVKVVIAPVLQITRSCRAPACVQTRWKREEQEPESIRDEECGIKSKESKSKRAGKRKANDASHLFFFKRKQRIGLFCATSSRFLPLPYILSPSTGPRGCSFSCRHSQVSPSPALRARAAQKWLRRVRACWPPCSSYARAPPCRRRLPPPPPTSRSRRAGPSAATSRWTTRSRCTPGAATRGSATCSSASTAR